MILKTRMAYTKTGPARYIAHLDLTRVFDRALRRGGIQVAYSEGFNPHPKIAFGPPLPVGVESGREFVDIDMKAPPEADQVYLDQIVADLQKQLPEGIQLLQAAIRPEGDKAIMAVANLACYEARTPFAAPLFLSELQTACHNWLARREVPYQRQQKDKQIAKDLRPFVQKIEIQTDPARQPEEQLEQATLLFQIITGNAGSVRPMEVLESLQELEKLPVDLPGVYTIRTGLYVQQPDGELLDPLARILR